MDCSLSNIEFILELLELETRKFCSKFESLGKDYGR